LRQQQFSTALHSRDIIGRAKGILMERYGLDDEAAFDVLVELSQSTNIPVRDLAERLNQSNHTAASRRVVSR
jgi:AmiR/NasT family two-component response regulator